MPKFIINNSYLYQKPFHIKILDAFSLVAPNFNPKKIAVMYPMA